MLGFWNQPPGSQEMREAMEGPKQEATGREGRHMRGREEGKNLDVWSFAGGICLLSCTTLGMPPSHWRSFEKYPFRWATLPREQKVVSSLQGYFTCNVMMFLSSGMLSHRNPQEMRLQGLRSSISIVTAAFTDGLLNVTCSATRVI